MKTKAILIALALGCVAGSTRGQAQEPSPAPGAQPPPTSRPADPRSEPGRDPSEAPLTAAQKEQVRKILSAHKAASLTAEQARSIHEQFRNAGLRASPAMEETLRAAGFDPEKLRELAPPPDRGERREPMGGRPEPGAGRKGDRPNDPGREAGGQGGYSIQQAISDRAQLNTLSFDALAFLTGDFGSSTFLPPGKAADFFGFQHMRDVDANQLGHNTSFVPLAANNVLFLLTPDQKAQLLALAREQEAMLADLACKRFPLIKAFCRQLAGDFPAGTCGLKREAVMNYTAEIFELDGKLSYQRAKVLGGIIRSLSAEQRAALGRMAFNNSATWPKRPDQLDKRGLSRGAHVAVMTYASEMFSWYAGSVEADVYFCPERHATYFGSFYMKDIPAMGNPNFSISTSLTGDSGEAFLAALNEQQRRQITGLVETQRQDLQEIVEVRRAIAVELRRFMKEETVPVEKVVALARRYGELDGEISYWYAMSFSDVARTLTPGQKKTLLKLRNLDSQFTCQGAYLYSQPIAMPPIPNTDFLFGLSGSPAGASAESSPAAGTADATRNWELSSPAFENGGPLPKEFTGDGAGASPPLQWTAPPAGTRSLALVMHHVDPQGKTKCYWILYNLPPGLRALPRGAQGMGRCGRNSINGETAYAPPHSKGPGIKTYVLTLYALSGMLEPAEPASGLTREDLLSLMQGKVLASAEAKAVYERGAAGQVTSSRSQGGTAPASATGL